MKTHQVLNRYFKKKKSKYGFSMRSLAANLGVSPSFLSRVLSGKKPVPYPLLLKLQSQLDIENEVFEGLRQAHINYVEDSSQSTASRGATKELKTQLEDWNLSEAASNRILRNWYYLPILEFTTLKRFDGRSESVALELNLARETVEVALRELESFGLVQRDSQNRWRKTQRKLRWSSSTASAEIGNFHSSMMTQAQRALKNRNQKAFDSRLINGITLTVSSKKVKQAQARINEFLHELANDLIDEDDQSAEVYHLASQFFPLSDKK